MQGASQGMCQGGCQACACSLMPRGFKPLLGGPSLFGIYIQYVRSHDFDQPICLPGFSGNSLGREMRTSGSRCIFFSFFCAINFFLTCPEGRSDSPSCRVLRSDLNVLQSDQEASPDNKSLRSVQTVILCRLFSDSAE